MAASGAPRPFPMFPLGTVLFPYAVLPLHVFEPRYRVMMRRCLERDAEFGVVLIERGNEVGGGDSRTSAGTVARIAQAAELDDGRLAVVATGVRRCRVTAWLPDDPFPQAEIVPWPDPDPVATDADARDAVLARFRALLDVWRAVDPSAPAEPPEVAADPVRASFELAAIAPIGPFDAQRVLEAEGAGARLALLGALVDERIADLTARIELDGDG